MARGTEVLFATTSDRLPSHPTNKDRRNSCLSLFHPLFVGWLGRRSLVATNRTSAPWPWFQCFYWPGQVGAISSDYHHLSLIPYTGQCLQIPICVCTVCMYVCAISHIMNSQDNVNLSSMTRLVCYNRDKSNGSKHSVWCAAMQSCTYVRMYSCSGGYANVTHKIWSPQWLAHSIHLFWACSADNKIIGFHWTANQIHRCNVGLISMQV